MATQDDLPTMMLPAQKRHVRKGLGIAWKIFLATAVVVVLAIGGAIGWSSVRVARLIDEATRDSFRSTEYVFGNLQAARYDRLKRMNALVAEDPVFKAVILETDEATQKDDLQRRKESLGADLAIATDPDGKTLARTDGMGRRGDDLSSWPIVKQAREGAPGSGLLVQGGRLYNAVASPIGTAGTDLAGFLVSGFALGDAVAQEMKKTAGTDVAFVAYDGDKPAVTASTLIRPEEAAAVMALAGGSPGAPGAPGEPQRQEIAGVPYLASALPLETPDRQRVGMLVVLRSIAKEMETLRRLQTSLAGIGLLAVLFAFLASWLVAQRITGPLRGLVRVAESVQEGQYGVEVPVSGGDEVGALGQAIRSMVRELKDKAELERYVAELGKDPDRATMMTGATTQAPRTTLVTATGKTGTIEEPKAGEVFAGRYEILEVIGTGGMGKVYRVRDRELDEIVALKTIRKELLGGDASGVIERFKQEIRLARKATHKNIMRTFDFGDAGGVQYLTMEYVKGYALKDLIRKQKEIPIGIALRIARQICTGLYAAHDAGIIHRDVKSHNILIQGNGEVKIMDFGIARPQESSGLTSAGAIVGTPEYMSPEQALGKDADFRSDVYSAGMVFYELFTGVVPFAGGAPLEIVMRHVQQQAAPPRQVKPTVPVAIEAIVVKMIQKDPAARYQSFAEVHAALSRIPLPDARTAVAA